MTINVLLDRAAQLMRDYGLRKSAARDAIARATRCAARAWQGRGEDPAAIDPDTDAEFIGAVFEALQIEARRRAN